MVPGIELDARVLAAVDEVFAAFHDDGHAPGLAYGLVIGNDIAHAGAVGSATVVGGGLHVDSVLRIASMTKSFTAATALLLRDEGQLRLDEPIGTYVPELAGWVLPTTDSPELTLRMLLTMSAGLPSDDPWADREESMGPEEMSALLASGLQLIAAPGTGFEYSNLGYAIVGQAIANITGERFHDVVRARLLLPLGLTSTGFSLSDVPAENVVPGHHRAGDRWVVEPFSEPGGFSAIGGLFSSVRDLATWVAGFTDAFPPRNGPDGDHPLRRASRREMQQMQRFEDVTVPAAQAASVRVQARTIGYGLGLVITHDTRWGHVVSHGGGYPGYGSHMRWHPPTGVGVIVLGNGRYTPASQPARTALELVLAAANAPSGRVTRWPRTRELQRAVQQLVASWDDALADEIFAINVDADLPRDERRAAFEAVSTQLGEIVDVDDPHPHSDAAADIEWWITGEHGRVRADLMLTPHAVPLVQSLGATFVGQVSDQLTVAARAVADELRASGTSGSDAELASIECISSKHRHSATFRLRIGAHEWQASLSIDADGGEVTERTIIETMPSAHRSHVSDDEIT